MSIVKIVVNVDCLMSVHMDSIVEYVTGCHRRYTKFGDGVTGIYHRISNSPRLDVAYFPKNTWYLS